VLQYSSSCLSFSLWMYQYRCYRLIRVLFSAVVKSNKVKIGMKIVIWKIYNGKAEVILLFCYCVHINGLGSRLAAYKTVNNLLDYSGLKQFFLGYIWFKHNKIIWDCKASRDGGGGAQKCKKKNQTNKTKTKPKTKPKNLTIHNISLGPWTIPSWKFNGSKPNSKLICNLVSQSNVPNMKWKSLSGERKSAENW
jgi:hypothetical protein